MGQAKEILQRMINHNVDVANSKLSDFTARIQEGNDYDALSWGDSALRASATKRIWLIIQSMLNNGGSIKRIYNVLLSVVLTDAKYVRHSTSVCSNFIEEEFKAARAEAVEALKGLVEEEKKEENK